MSLGDRNFTNTGRASYAAGSLNNTDISSTFSVAAEAGGPAVAPVGWPAVPFEACIDRENAAAEVVLVTAVAGSSVTVTRASQLGADAYGSVTQAHDSGASIEPVYSAGSAQETVDHVADTTLHHTLGTGAANAAAGNHLHTGVYDPAGSVTTHVGLADPHTQYQRESEKAAASGYASLDGTTKVPIAQVPTGSTSSTVSLGDHTHAVLGGGPQSATSAGGHVAIGGTQGCAAVTNVANPSGVSGRFLLLFRFNGFTPDSAVALRVTWGYQTASPTGAGYGVTVALGTTQHDRATLAGAFGGSVVVNGTADPTMDFRIVALNGSADGATIDNSSLTVIRLV